MSNSGNYYFSNYFTKTGKGPFAISKIAKYPISLPQRHNCHVK